MTALKTDDALLARLKTASSRKLTAEEVRRQRISFAMGMMGKDSTLTRNEIERIVSDGTRETKN